MSKFNDIVAAASTKRLLPLIEQVASQWAEGTIPDDAAVAAHDLARILTENGIGGRIVSGHYNSPFPWPDGPDSPPTQHTWVEAQNLILDPVRRAAFGVDELITPFDTDNAMFYVGEHWTSF